MTDFEECLQYATLDGNKVLINGQKRYSFSLPKQVSRESVENAFYSACQMFNIDYVDQSTVTKWTREIIEQYHLKRIAKERPAGDVKGRGMEDPDATEAEKRAALAGEVMKAPLKTFRDTEETLFWKDGKYHPGGDALIKEMVQRIGKFEITNHMRAEVMQTVKVLTYVERSEFDKDLAILNLKNGLLNIETGDFKEHTSEYLSLTQIPVNYDPKATCPAFVKFLTETLEPEHIAVVVKLLGYLLFRRTIYEKAFMLEGEGSNGKSTFINAIEAFLGRLNCSSVSLQDLTTNRFAKADLYGKLANLFADIPSEEIASTGDFKMLVSGDPIGAERKHQHRFTFENHAKLIFSANVIPKSADKTYAYMRRWVIIPFPRVFEGDGADEYLLEKLTTEAELSGILNLAIKGLKKLRAERGFKEQDIEEIVKAYDLGASRIRSFLEEKCIVEPGNDSLFEESTRLREAYRKYSREHRTKYYSEVHFGRELKDLGINHRQKRIGKKKVYCDFGIALKEDRLKVLGKTTTILFPRENDIVHIGKGEEIVGDLPKTLRQEEGERGTAES